MKTQLAIVCLALALSASLHAADLKAEIQPDYVKMSKAFAANDYKVFDAYLAKNYVLVQPGGTQWTRERTLADLKRQMTMMKGSKWDRQIIKVKGLGQAAIVVVNGTFHGSFKMKDGKTHVFDLKASSTDSWLLTPRHQLTRSVITSMDAKIDGKKAGG